MFYLFESYLVYSMVNVFQLQAHLDILTGWKLGKGPCGPHCTKHNVGESTALSRKAIEAKQPEYFGTWTAEYKKSPGEVVNHDTLNVVAINHTTPGFSEKVIAVNEQAQWEQEWATMTIPLAEHVHGEDIM